jgi:hypothetical protein
MEIAAYGLLALFALSCVAGTMSMLFIGTEPGPAKRRIAKWIPLEKGVHGESYGYKALYFEEGQYYSPTHKTPTGGFYLWVDGKLTAEYPPTENNYGGICIEKRRRSRGVQYYKTLIRRHPEWGIIHVVKVQLFGEFAETATGGRVWHAEIIQDFDLRRQACVTRERLECGTLLQTQRPELLASNCVQR